MEYKKDLNSRMFRPFWVTKKVSYMLRITFSFGLIHPQLNGVHNTYYYLEGGAV